MADRPSSTTTEALPPYQIELLGKAHDRTGFVCGSAPLDLYFKTQVTQDMRRRIAKCFVAVEVDTGQIAGFYTLSAISIAHATIPDDIVKGLPRYPIIPAALIGRLAVAEMAQGQKLGTALIAHAIESIAESSIGVFTALVDAKDAAAIAFYERHGFIAVKGHADRLILPVATALKAFGMKP